MFVPNILKRSSESVELYLPEIDENENKKLKNIFGPPQKYKKMTRKNTNPTALILAIQSVVKREVKNKDFNPESEEFKKMLEQLIRVNPIRPLIDPNAPVKAKSAYMYFNAEQRKNHKGPNTELFKTLGESWKNLSAEKKKPYEKMAEKDKKRYKAEMEKYVPPSPEELMKLDVNSKKKAMGVNSTKRAEDPSKPKRPKGTYMFFQEEKREAVKARLEKESPDNLANRVRTELKNMWSNMTDSEKKRYQDMYKAADAKFKKDLAEYESKNTTKTVPQKKSEKKPKKDKNTSKPEVTPEQEVTVEQTQTTEDNTETKKGRKRGKPAAKEESKNEAKSEKGKKPAAPTTKGKKPPAPKPQIIEEENEEDEEEEDENQDDIFNDDDEDDD